MGDGLWRGMGWWYCVVYGRYLEGAVFRSISCNAPLKVSRLLGINVFRGSLFHCAVVWGKEAVFVVVVGGGYLCGSRLSVSRLEVLIVINI